jgi:phosphate transport system substrate-binding protein
MERHMRATHTRCLDERHHASIASGGLLTIAVALVVSSAAGCGGRDRESESRSAPQLVRVDGSSTVFPISEAVAEEFQREHRDVRVTVGVSGTGGGFQKFCRGETDISNASRPIRPVEIEACAKAGFAFIELPVAYDGLAVVVHPQNEWVDFMTVAELKRLWEPAAEQTITRWSQIRRGWPDREVHLFGAGVDSGTFDYFTEAINGKEKASRGDYTSSEDDNLIVQGVSGDPNALGYFGYAYYEENRDQLKLVPIDDEDDENGKGPIAPSPETVRGGTYRPLSRPLFVYVSEQSLDRPEVRALVEFHLNQAEALVREVGYVPLTDRERQLVTERYATRAIGTMYGAPGAAGQPLEQLLGSR